MSVQRNDPCPCGSGRKYKHCHGKAAPSPPSSAEGAWRRLRAVLDGFPTTMLRFVRDVYGDAALDEAWDEFNLWEEDQQGFDPDSPHLQLFMPWFFHRWTPDPEETRVADATLHDRAPTSVLLERKGRRLDPLLRRYLEACVATPFGFHEIVGVEPGNGFRARDVLTGDERQVMERSASQSMQLGDILFGQLVTSEGITLMEACSAHVLPPHDKIELIDLRERIAAHGSISSDTLDDWDIELREVYLDRMEALRNPPIPRLQNTDGEPTAFHRLSFEIPSAQAAFDALNYLAFDETEADLLESAQMDADGRVRRVSFAWKVAGNPVHRSWENTVLGHIEIDGDRLVADVNSAERAARLKEIVESRCPGARHTGTDVQTLEEALAQSAGDEEPPGDAEATSLAQNPEVLERIRAMTAEHYEDWIRQEIPALGGLSPMDAVRDKGGREKVEALITQFERDGRRMSPPLDESVTRRMRQRLGLGG